MDKGSADGLITRPGTTVPHGAESVSANRKLMWQTASKGLPLRSLQHHWKAILLRAEIWGEVGADTPQVMLSPRGASAGWRWADRNLGMFNKKYRALHLGNRNNPKQ